MKVKIVIKVQVNLNDLIKKKLVMHNNSIFIMYIFLDRNKSTKKQKKHNFKKQLSPQDYLENMEDIRKELVNIEVEKMKPKRNYFYITLNF